MNDIQNVIDRQLGNYCPFNYDNILKRLVVDKWESYNGLQGNIVNIFEQDPPIFACRFSEAAGYEHILAIANEDGVVAIQDTITDSSRRRHDSFQCHHNAVFDLAWMPQHMNFVAVSGDHTASLWDVAESAPKKLMVFSNHTRSVKTVVFRPREPSVFATGARDGHILIWDVRATNQPSLVLKPDNCLMNCHSSFTPKTPGSHSKRPRIDNHRATSITGLIFQDEQTLISCGECDGNIKVWDLRKNYNIYKREPLPKHSIPYCGSSTKNGYTNLIIDEARTKLYASCMDNVIYCFNISTYNSLPEQRYVGHENSTFYIKTSLSPDSMYLVSGSSDKNAYIWNVKYSEPIVKLTGHQAEVTCAAWCQKDNVKIVTCSDDAKYKIWRIGKEFIIDESELRGRAEIVPHIEMPNRLQWGTKTPNSLKRKCITTPNSNGSKRKMQSTLSSRKTKRCLTDLMNMSKENDSSEVLAKRLKPDIPEGEEELLPTGIKRRYNSENNSFSPKQCCSESNMLDWTYINKPGTSFMTPTKNYETKNCRTVIAKSPYKVFASPEQISPTTVKLISFTTPTKKLPNFKLNGEAPHLSLMSPLKRKQDTTDWLTLMARNKKNKPSEIVEKTNLIVPPNSDECVPQRRNSVSDKTAKALTRKSKTLLSYFSVSIKKG